MQDDIFHKPYDALNKRKPKNMKNKQSNEAYDKKP